MPSPPRGAGPAAGPGGRTRRVPVALAALLVLGSVACGGPPEPVVVPVFPAAITTVAAVGDRATDPTCEDLLPVEEVQAVLGLPVDGVAVRSVDGVPAPSVGHLARVTCRYAVVDPAWPVHGEVLVVVAAQFVDDAAARAQSARNVADLAGTSPSAPVPMGAAAAVQVGGAGGHDLLVAYGRGTVDLTLAGGAGLPGPPADVLTDLARRVLARADRWTRTGADGPIGDGPPGNGVPVTGAASGPGAPA